MKVLELVLKWNNGGVERYIEDLVCTGGERGIDCRVASVTTTVSSNRVEGYGPLIAGGLKAVLLKGHEVESFIADGGYDVVHIHGNNGLVFKFAHLAKKAGAKTVVHSHNSSFGAGAKGAKRLFTSVERWLHRGDCDGRLACSRAAGDFLFIDSPFRVAPNGVDVPRFAFNPTERAVIRTELGIPCDAPVIGFAASFIDAKNPLFALDVFRGFSKRRSDAFFIACGEGELLEAFESEACDFIESGRCVCVGHVADIERYYCAIDVLLAPSKYEGLPINLVEAQTSGLSIVMSDSITNEAVVVPNLCTCMEPESGIESWVNAVDDSLSGKQLRSLDCAEAVSIAGLSQPECFYPVFDMYAEIMK